MISEGGAMRCLPRHPVRRGVPAQNISDFNFLKRW